MTKSLSKEKYTGSITKISSVGQDAKGRKLVHFSFVNSYTEPFKGLVCEVDKEYYMANACGKAACAVLALKEGVEAVITGRMVGMVHDSYPLIEVDSVTKAGSVKKRVTK